MELKKASIVQCWKHNWVQVEITGSGRLGLKAVNQPANKCVLSHSLIPSTAMKWGSIHNKGKLRTGQLLLLPSFLHQRNNNWCFQLDRAGASCPLANAAADKSWGVIAARSTSELFHWAVPWGGMEVAGIALTGGFLVGWWNDFCSSAKYERVETGAELSAGEERAGGSHPLLLLSAWGLGEHTWILLTLVWVRWITTAEERKHSVRHQKQTWDGKVEQQGKSHNFQLW